MSTVIKAGQAAKLVNRLVSVDLSDHLAQANAVIEAANRDAAKTMADARLEATRLQDEAKQRGFEAGYELGYAKGLVDGEKEAHENAMNQFDERHKSVVSAMEQVVERYDCQKEELKIAAEAHVLDFAVLIARRLTFEIGRTRSDAVKANFRRALELVGTKTNLTVRLHPSDRQTVEEFAGTVLGAVAETDRVKIVEDSEIAPGGCQVHSEETNVDATLETQVTDLVSLLVGQTE